MQIMRVILLNQLLLFVLTHGLGGEPVDWSNTEFIIRVNE